jgi:hypothetical protein
MHCNKCPVWLYKKCDDYYDCVYPIYAAGVKVGKNTATNTRSLKRAKPRIKRA